MDHFSDAEAQRIFAEAARARPADPPQDGLSLDELREIGRAAGLDPDAVSAAAAALRNTPPDAPMWGRTPLATRRSRVVSGVLSDAAWADAVESLRRAFGVPGVTEVRGQTRTWTHAIGSSGEVVVARLTAEPTGEATRLTLDGGNWGERRAARIVVPVLLTVGAALAVAAALGGNAAGAVVALVACAALAALASAGLRASAARRTRDESHRFDAALDRVARLIPTSAPPSPAADTPVHTVAAAEPLLDLPATDDAAAPTDSVSPARRTRA